MDPHASDVRIADDKLAVTLVDGRTFEGIRWPDVDEDISSAGLLRGERDTVSRTTAR